MSSSTNTQPCICRALQAGECHAVEHDYDPIPEDDLPSSPDDLASFHQWKGAKAERARIDALGWAYVSGMYKDTKEGGAMAQGVANFLNHLRADSVREGENQP